MWLEANRPNACPHDFNRNIDRDNHHPEAQGRDRPHDEARVACSFDGTRKDQVERVEEREGSDKTQENDPEGHDVGILGRSVIIGPEQTQERFGCKDKDPRPETRGR
jgi:hypothetical protein